MSELQRAREAGFRPASGEVHGAFTKSRSRRGSRAPPTPPASRALAATWRSTRELVPPRRGNMKNSHQPCPAPRSRRALPERDGVRPRRWLHAALALSAGTVLAWAWSALPATLTRGPYLQSTSSTGITVVFRTSAAGTSTLRYGTRQGPPWDFEVAGPSATNHVIALTNLRPGTRYYYEVSSGGSVLASGEDVYFR